MTRAESDLQHILGDMDDSTAVAILALRPSVAQLEEAQVWLSGAGDVLGKEHRPLDGVVAQIYDMLFIAEEDEVPPPPLACGFYPIRQARGRRTALKLRSRRV